MRVPALLLLSCTAPLATAVNVLHRLHTLTTPSEQARSFVPRGTLTADETSSLNALTKYLDARLEDVDVETDWANELYQVTLEYTDTDGPGQHPPANAVSSVKACHLAGATSDTLVLHQTSPTSAPYSLNYYVSPIPHDGACPVLKGKRARAAAVEGVRSFVSRMNTTVIVRTPHAPAPPTLRAAPPLTPEGTPLVPPPEKTFIQKYWIYIAVIMGAFLLTAGPEEEGGGQQQAS